MKIIKLGIVIWLVLAALVNIGLYRRTDKDYFIEEYIVPFDPIAQRKQDSLVNRALIKHDTTPFKTHYVTTQ